MMFTSQQFAGHAAAFGATKNTRVQGRLLHAGKSPFAK
jgi:hypothetical protein